MGLSNEHGRIGEEIAVRYLERKGYKIVERNFAGREISGPMRGELDIVARKDGTLVFVEVKALFESRGSVSPFLPEDKINRVKRSRLRKTIEQWLVKHRISPDAPVRVDVLALRIDRERKNAKVRQIENIALAD